MAVEGRVVKADLDSVHPKKVSAGIGVSSAAND
jgi:hypothetical protein